MALREQTVAIAVVGVTGSGKSTFINLASGSNLPVSNSPSSTELKSSTFSLDGQDVMLIDTPGFDDTTPNVLGVLKSISDHFAGLYSQGIKLAGVIYMHCVTADPMRNASRRNFQILSKFCGDSDTSLRDVLIVTGKRAADGPSGVEERKQESIHEDEFFGSAIDKGARVLCHDGSQASAHAILRHLFDPKRTVPPARWDSADQKTDLGRATTSAAAVRELTDQIAHRTKAFGELFQGINAATLAEDETTEKILPEEAAKDSLEEIERIRYDLEKMVTGFATENSRLADENRRYKNDFTAQKAEAELRIRLLGEERRARELAEASRERAEAQLAEERALWERQRTERVNLREHAAIAYGALIFVLLCVSRYAFNSSTSLL